MRGAAGVGERARWPQALPAGKRTEGLLLVRIGGSGPCRELEAGSIHRTSPFTHSRLLFVKRRCTRVPANPPRGSCRQRRRRASCEAPQRLLAGFAFRDLLAVVGTTRCVLPGLAYADHVQGVVELAVPAQREPVAHHIAA